MKSIENYIKQIKNNEDIENYLSSECDVDFLMEGAKCNYELTPFACDGSGGIYAVLDNSKIGYIDSEGQAGIIANNIKDFFNIIINCGIISDYAKFNCLKNLEKFIEYYNEIEIPREEVFIKEFIKDNLLENNPNKIYELLKDAVMSEPKLVIEAIDEDYVDYIQLFNI